MPIWRRPDTGGFRALLLSVLLVACGEDSQDRVTGAENGPGLVPLAVAGVISQADGTAAVLLHTPNGQNVVVPVTGCAAQTIDAKLRGESFPRPLTHDLFTVIADSLALSVDRVVLDGTVDGSVTASIVSSRVIAKAVCDCFDEGWFILLIIGELHN